MIDHDPPPHIFVFVDLPFDIRDIDYANKVAASDRAFLAPYGERVGIIDRLTELTPEQVVNSIFYSVISDPQIVSSIISPNNDYSRPYDGEEIKTDAGVYYIGFPDKELPDGINYEMLDLTEEITDLRDAEAEKYQDINYVRALGFKDNNIYVIKTSDYTYLSVKIMDNESFASMGISPVKLDTAPIMWNSEPPAITINSN